MPAALLHSTNTDVDSLISQLSKFVKIPRKLFRKFPSLDVTYVSDRDKYDSAVTYELRMIEDVYVAEKPHPMKEPGCNTPIRVGHHVIMIGRFPPFAEFSCDQTRLRS